MPWGEKAFGNYLGADRSRWAGVGRQRADEQGSRFPGSDPRRPGAEGPVPRRRSFGPERSKRLPQVSGQELVLRRQEAYDHSYWFIQSFIEDHLKWHAERLHR